MPEIIKYVGKGGGSSGPGTIERVQEHENGQLSRKPIDKRLDLKNHSPDGFQWGYGGSGPGQAALAILADYYDDETAMKHYQKFKWEVVSNLPAEWELTAHEIERNMEHIRSDV